MKKLSRRNLLRHMAAGSSAPLWLNSFAGEANASEKPPMRLITLYNPFGTINRFWRPQGLAGSYSKSAWTLNYDHSILAPLEGFKDKITVLDGIDYKACYSNSRTGHEAGIASSLTGARMETTFTHKPDDIAKGSIDQYVASVIGSNTPIRSLSLAAGFAGGTSVYDTTSYAPGGIKIPTINDPVSLYNQLFSNTSESGSELSTASKIRQSAVDFALRDINAIKANSPAKRREILDVNLDSLRNIENSFENIGVCSLGQKPASISYLDLDNADQVIDLQLDLLVQALSCQITNVASFSFNLNRIPFIDGLNIDIHNDVTHMLGTKESSSSTPQGLEWKMIAYHNYLAQKVERLMRALASRTEADGSTLLDNTVILWVNELGYSGIHGNMNVPWLLLGGAQGKLDMGAWYKLSQDHEYDCTYFFAQEKCSGSDKLALHAPHNNVLVSILNAFGINDNHFGYSGITGQLAGLNV